MQNQRTAFEQSKKKIKHDRITQTQNYYLKEIEIRLTTPEAFN